MVGEACERVGAAGAQGASATAGADAPAGEFPGDEDQGGVEEGVDREAEGEGAEGNRVIPNGKKFVDSAWYVECPVFHAWITKIYWLAIYGMPTERPKR